MPTLLPFEFVVQGIPLSQQASGHSKNRWKTQIKNSALVSWVQGASPSTEKVQVTIIYFYNNTTPLDVDNIIKPILDAMVNLIYVDDKQVTDVISRKRDFNQTFILQNASPLIASNLINGVEFVYIKIENAPDPRRL